MKDQKKIICAIHQPNFFPWCGYFDKIRKADIFVFLDAVNYPKSGSKGMGSWSNRVMINVQGNPQWVTCALKRESGDQLIKNIETSTHLNWRKRILSTIHHNYSKRSNYHKTMDLITPLIMNESSLLADYNIHAIKSISQALKLDCQFVRQSELNVNSSSTQLLIDITKTVKADTYLCGNGASGYQDDSLFSSNSIELMYQNFKPDIYGDPKHFHQGLSIIDYLMEVEW